VIPILQCPFFLEGALLGFLAPPLNAVRSKKIETSVTSLMLDRRDFDFVSFIVSPFDSQTAFVERKLHLVPP